MKELLPLIVPALNIIAASIIGFAIKWAFKQYEKHKDREERNHQLLIFSLFATRHAAEVALGEKFKEPYNNKFSELVRDEEFKAR